MGKLIFRACQLTFCSSLYFLRLIHLTQPSLAPRRFLRRCTKSVPQKYVPKTTPSPQLSKAIQSTSHMIMTRSNFTTTYKYRPLESDRHIRLLQAVSSGDNSDNDKAQPPTYRYRIVHKKVSDEETPLGFEAISYTWGAPDRVAGLSIIGEEESAVIGLTKNLSQALPHLSHYSKTKLLWIDQLCINQADSIEKSHQIGLMSTIYRSALQVLIWLGPADNNSRLCKQFLSAVHEMLLKMPNSEKMLPGSETFNPDIRYLVVRSTFISPNTDPVYAPAIREFFTRPWFSRAWVVQELLLHETSIFLVGDVVLDMQDLSDLHTIPPNHMPDVGADQSWYSYNILMNLKLHPFSNDEQPLSFLRLMYQASQEFQTSVLGDRLYAFLGMINDRDSFTFTPDYAASTKLNFTKFAAALAQHFGSLDFLSLWSANLDELLPGTPEELRGFPSWVPSWSATPLSAPFRLATGGTRSLRCEIRWNAANGRRHLHSRNRQNSDAATTGRLCVQGKIIDSVSLISSARFHRYWDPDDEYLDGLVAQIKHDISGVEEWTKRDMIQFLNIISSNGNPPAETAEEVLGIEKKPFWNEVANLSGYNETLGTCLSVGRGRRFMRTKSGRLGLAPYIGTKARCEEKEGSSIAILHGCSVPLVMDCVNEARNEWKIVGDCYVEDIMHGEAVSWVEEYAQTFILI